VYRRTFVRRRWYRLNRLLHELSLYGLGVLNYETDELSGESALLGWAVGGRRVAGEPTGPGSRALAHAAGLVVLDVGANRGDYARKVRELAPDARVFAFEPHPVTFPHLLAAARDGGFTAVNAACGEEPGTLTLYDYAGSDTGTQHASLYRGVIEELHAGRATGVDVRVVTVDAFIAEHGIERVRLLKVDTEGHEAGVLRGARGAIAAGRVELVQFEFNAMNVTSRTFFKDFLGLLPGYRFYRLLPDGWVPLDYNPLRCELFGFQNVLAVRPGFGDD
jgi:FkbM family methyltransferase